MRRILFLFLILIVLVNFSFTIRKGEKQILEKLALIEKMLVRMDSNISLFSSEISTIYKKITLIESKVGGIALSSADNKQNSEDVAVKFQALKQEFTDVKKSLGDIIQKLSEKRITKTEVDNGEAGGENPAVTSETAENSKINAEVDNEEEKSPDIYLMAYSDYLTKNYDLAIKGFRKFIQYFPGTQRAKKSLYWIGECYYVQRKFRDAIQVFDELLLKSGDDPNISDAMLKKGFALIQLGRHMEGREVLKKLISKYPFSEISSLAKQKLKEIAE